MNDFIKKNEEQFKTLKSYIKEHENKKSSLIMILHKTQEVFGGYLPVEALELIAHELDMPLARIHGVVSFYSFFNMTKKGKYSVNVCMGTACFVKGAKDILDEFKNQLGIDMNETTEDGLFTLESLRCIGTCGLAPVVSVNGKVYGNVKKDEVKSIIAECKKDGAKNE